MSASANQERDAAFIKEATEALLVEILDDDCDDLQSVRAIARTLRAAGQVIPEPPNWQMMLALIRPYVEEAASKGYDGTNGHAIRLEAQRRLALIDEAYRAAMVEVGVTVEATDTQVLDWLEHQVVEVRTPVRYGSLASFFASPTSDEDAEAPSDLRAQVRAALNLKRPA